MPNNKDLPLASNPWALYDQLIEGVPDGIEVVDYCIGDHWSYLIASCGMGISYTFPGGGRSTFKDDPRDYDLRGLAALSKSWCFREASLGVAALNAWYSQRQRVLALGAQFDEDDDHVGSADQSNPFSFLKDNYLGKKVTVVGHFPNVEHMAQVADLTVLERNCTSQLDTPDPACEYILPSQDFAFITGTTITNKTAPRLLQLCNGVITTMLGPSVVPAQALRDAGVDYVSGSVVLDEEAAQFAIKGGSKALWRHGIKKFWIGPSA